MLGSALELRKDTNREGWGRGKNGKDQRSFAFAQAFGRRIRFRSTMRFERTRAN